MLDRMISGAGAVTDGADRSVRLLTGDSSGGRMAARPGSIIVAVALFAVAGLLVLAGLDASDPTTPATLRPAAIARASTRDFAERTYARIDGSLLTTWVETYDDLNDNGIEDADEHGVAWFYWLIDPETRRGVTVRSTRAPSSILRFDGAGVIAPVPGATVADDDGWFDGEVAAAGLSLDPTVVIDATGATGSSVPIDLGAGAPANGTAVEVTAARTGAYRALCTTDPDRDRVCDDAEIDRFEVAVFDPGSKRGMLVLLRDLPELSSASLTGLLHREERAVDDALTTEGLDFEDFDVDVSARYILDENMAPGSAPLAFVVALALVGVATTILVGLAGGYLIYRRSTSPLPAPATSVEPGERIALRITGLVRTQGSGTEHLREAPGDLIRFALGRRVVVDPDVEAPDDGDGPPASTLIVERREKPQGVAVGLGELRRLSAGEVMTFRAPRPALRLVAGSGPLLLSFDTVAERDRAAAELLDESGFGSDGSGMEPG